ncbi:MAG: peptidyl-prolyl cis-trans isomerase, partial [Psittacicella sp.]
SIKETAINNLINNALIAQYQNKLKMTINPANANIYIVRDKMFQENGKFSSTLYQNILNENNISSQQYSQSILNTILNSQFQQALIQTSITSSVDFNNLVNSLSQARVVKVLKLNSENAFKKINITNNQIQEYYKNNISKFTTSAQAKINYIEFSKSDIKPEVISQKDIENYYNTNIENYSTPASFQVKDIILKDLASASKVENLLLNGKSFDKVSSTYNTNAELKSNGGNLGWVNKSTYSNTFYNKVASLKVGEVSKPILIDGFYHIILVENLKPKVVKPLSEVSNEIKTSIEQGYINSTYESIKEKATELAYKDSASLNSISKYLNKPVLSSGYITKENPGNLNNANVVYNIFSTPLLTNNENSGAIDTGDTSFMVVRVADYRKAGLQPIKYEYATIKTYLQKQQEAKDLLSENASKISKLNLKGKPASTFEKIDFSKSTDIIYNLNSPSELDKAIFTMKLPTNLGATYKLVDINSNIYLVQLTGETKINLSQNSLEEFKNVYIQNENIGLYNSIAKTLNTDAHIVKNKSF